MCAWAMRMKCWLRAGDFTHGWSMLMWCEELLPAFLLRSLWFRGIWLPFFSAFLSFHRHHANTMDNSHQHTSRRALETAASHQYKLKKTTRLSAQHLCFHIFRLNTVKRVFIFLPKPFYRSLLQRSVFIYISAHRRGTQLIPACELCLI